MKANEFILNEMPARRKYTDEQRQQMVRLYVQGLSLSEIAQTLQINPLVIRANIIAAVGEKEWLELQKKNSFARSSQNQTDSKNKNLTTFQIKQMHSDLLKGLTFTEVGKKHNIARSSVAKAIKSYYGIDEFNRIVNQSKSARRTGTSGYINSNRKYSLAQSEKMKELFLQGKSLNEIARMFNDPDPSTIRRTLIMLVGPDKWSELQAEHRNVLSSNGINYNSSKKNLGPDDIAKIKQMSAAGRTSREIAAEIGISKTAVLYYLNKGNK